MPSHKPLCLVRSSINIDQVFTVPHVVRPGETISSTELQLRPGGKGANVSAAVGLAGQHVILSGAVGRDAEWPIDQMADRKVDTRAIHVFDDAPTGRAFIQVAQDGENSIVLLKGANFHPYPDADDPKKVFHRLQKSPPTYLILQNEIPLHVTKAFLDYAHIASPRCLTIFNPSPMLDEAEVRAFEWRKIDVLIVNQGEAQDLLNILSDHKQHDASNANDVLYALSALPALQDISWLVMTKGAKGVSAMVKPFRKETKDSTANKHELVDVQAVKPKAVRDTTGAGDTFAGNLVAGLMRLHGERGGEADAHGDVRSAQNVLQWAAMAAAIAVERLGAMESIPRFEEVQRRRQQFDGSR